MRVGVLTLPLGHNIGGILQCASLVQVLRSMGLEVFLFDKKMRVPLWKRCVVSVLEVIPFQNFKGIKGRRAEKRLHASFISSQIGNISRPVSSSKDIANVAQELSLDAVIVGSDQVWRFAYIADGAYDAFFFSEIDGGRIKKIAYAASFGKGSWENVDTIASVSDYLRDFHSLSVREASGVKLCEREFGCLNVEHVLDPTMLIGQEYYESLMAESMGACDERLVFTYLLDRADWKDELIRAVKTKYGLTVFSEKNVYKEETLCSIPEWLSSFRDADFVITDSFHGVVFSILFKKQFVAIGNRERGIDRFQSLMESFGLLDRLVFSGDDLICIGDIDYGRIECELSRMRSDSIRYLTNALS